MIVALVGFLKKRNEKRGVNFRSWDQVKLANTDDKTATQHPCLFKPVLLYTLNLFYPFIALILPPSECSRTFSKQNSKNSTSIE
jgi:hypothetical protein